ncbi:unnamed protein product [Paramecium pentaurelia]|uniref:Uncharacterized protein n=1 Tax=Paramecium pentaurelia TaxID=43138 RepID=A0A8S1WQR6_9CILI|nr:unnamed protein product [Paramecium pentaurelia]
MNIIILGWIITNGLSNLFSICSNNQYIFGGVQGFNMNTRLKKSIENLAPHYKIKIQIVFWRIDSWNNDYLKVTVDGSIKFSKTYSFYSSLPNLCGATNFNDEVDYINFEFLHINNKADIEIFVIDNGDNDEFWGIQNFEISLYQCSNNCISCNLACLQCKIGYQVINGQCEEYCGDSYADVEVRIENNFFQILRLQSCYNQIILQFMREQS